MSEQSIVEFYKHRMQYAATLVDYSLGIGQNNRIIESNAIPAKAYNAAAVILGPNPNRVGLTIALGTQVAPTTARQDSVLFVDDTPASNGLFEWLYYSKEADIAAVTPSPAVYKPFRETILTIGPVIQRKLIANQPFGLSLIISVCELVMVPKCCDYLGGMK